MLCPNSPNIAETLQYRTSLHLYITSIHNTRLYLRNTLNSLTMPLPDIAGYCAALPLHYTQCWALLYHCTMLRYSASPLHCVTLQDLTLPSSCTTLRRFASPKHYYAIQNLAGTWRRITWRYRYMTIRFPTLPIHNMTMRDLVLPLRHQILLHRTLLHHYQILLHSTLLYRNTTIRHFTLPLHHEPIRNLTFTVRDNTMRYDALPLHHETIDYATLPYHNVTLRDIATLYFANTSLCWISIKHHNAKLNHYRTLRKCTLLYHYNAILYPDSPNLHITL